MRERVLAEQLIKATPVEMGRPQTARDQVAVVALGALVNQKATMVRARAVMVAAA
jgi:hypothetical protein